MKDAMWVYHIILLLCILGLIVSTFEYYFIRRSFASSGVYSWKILQLRFNNPRGAYISSLFDVLFDEQGVRGIIILRLLTLLLVILVPFGSMSFAVIMGVLVLNNLLFNWRRAFGDDGSDQMNSVVLLTVLLCVGPYSNEFILKIGLWFIALQVCLSYTAAGVAKLISPQWRSGEAVYRIFNTGTYGVERVARFLEHRKTLSIFLCWSVIGMEILFPLCLILPGPLKWVFLAWGALFHLQCAIIMGLNSFLWAFISTYPAILYVSSLLDKYRP
jgi:hypothetical protein